LPAWPRRAAPPFASVRVLQLLLTLLSRVATAGRASLCVRLCLAPRAHPPFARGHGGPLVPLRPFVSCSSCSPSFRRGHGGPRLPLRAFVSCSSCSPSFRVWPRRAAFHFASGRVAQLVLTVLRADCCTAADSHLVLEAGRVATSPVVLPRSVVPCGCACGVPAYASVPASHMRVFVAALSQRRLRQGIAPRRLPELLPLRRPRRDVVFWWRPLRCWGLSSCGHGRRSSRQRDHL